MEEGALGRERKSGKRGIPVPELESDGKSDLAHAALCQNSPPLPSSGQIVQEIMAAEPRGKGRSSAATTPTLTALRRLPKHPQTKNDCEVSAGVTFPRTRPEIIGNRPLTFWTSRDDCETVFPSPVRLRLGLHQFDID